MNGGFMMAQGSAGKWCVIRGVTSTSSARPQQFAQSGLIE